jgi:hypothetical protein
MKKTLLTSLFAFGIGLSAFSSAAVLEDAIQW